MRGRNLPTELAPCPATILTKPGFDDASSIFWLPGDAEKEDKTLLVPCPHDSGLLAHGLGTCQVALTRCCSEIACSVLQYIFVDAYAQYLWITFDFCSTVHGFSIPFRAADLLLHSKASNLLLGFDRSHPNKQLWKSDDFGQTWIMIQEHVKSFSW